MTPKVVNGLVLFNQSDFYGMDHPDYLTCFVELGEDRNKITDVIANAILQYKTSSPEQFQEMLFSQLGAMGFDSDEEKIYDTFWHLIHWVAQRLSRMLPDGILNLVMAMEDADWVNVIYGQYEEPKDVD